MVDLNDGAHKTKTGRPRRDRHPVTLRFTSELVERLRAIEQGQVSAEVEKACRAYFKMAAA